MSVQRIFLIFVFFLASFFLWKSWNNKNYFHFNDSIVHSHENNYFNNLDYKNSKNSINIKTDVYNIIIDKSTGDIKVVDLLKYKNKQGSSENFPLLRTSQDYVYNVHGGLIDVTHDDGKKDNYILKFQSDKNLYELLPNQEKLIVPLKFIGKDGVQYKKIFTFTRGKYDVSVKYKIINLTKKNIFLNMFGEIIQTFVSPEEQNFFNNFPKSYRGTAYSAFDMRYKKYSFYSISKKRNLFKETSSGWIAMLQKYFVTAWIPPQNIGINTFYTKNVNSDTAVIGYRTSNVSVPKYSTYEFNSVLWMGPEIQKEMSKIAPNLDLTVDYGCLWFLSQPLFKILSFVNKIIGNWGFSIIFLTIVIRTVLSPLSKSQYFSVSKLKSLKPELEYLKNKYKNDKEKMSKKILELYKKENISPFSGFLALIFQTPIFLSFYYMLSNSIELRHSPFIFWIHDLSSYDPFYVLPLLMGITVFIMHKISSENNDVETIIGKIQEAFSYIIPVLFVTFFLFFPSGLVLYYIVSNIISIIQQKFIYKTARN
ncbi:MAG: membrane protein insertase YidC [Buchnera aphidicola (Periphyllus lyropictus)]|uniref:membrane protein insertase YidC n=1 Tax=Buchnera aphidicola TaxID=9 RepID=UPI001EC6E63D|nr:membrane protein insertase YidC [Buchnera aphidicola]NIH16790.1 membrane protein insertase YidC [Buchnera aphidicola (Periphyllus lyropictus)]USS94686.1 membrane protein insertase YidC [Buchnera aphidicola (Periphyllus lyropictus)]